MRSNHWIKKEDFIQLKNFFEYITSVLGSVKIQSDDHTFYGSLAVYNNKDSKNKTTYELHVKGRDKQEYLKESKNITDYVLENRAMQELCMACAYNLNKIGRWSWTTLNFDDLTSDHHRGKI